ncbi:hypothetical protein GCM10007928_52090 [Sulfitobacter porphyrae]|nr:hypothetical protein GCM10007928_52090 [Sulfitobacter porphyrae]
MQKRQLCKAAGVRPKESDFNVHAMQVLGPEEARVRQVQNHAHTWKRVGQKGISLDDGLA